MNIDRFFDSVPFTTLVQFDRGRTPMSVWFELHSLNKFWENNYLSEIKAGRPALALEVLDKHRQEARFLADFEVERWVYMCAAVGWTPIACTATSWCKGASLDDVLALWRKLGAPSPVADSSANLAALLINPEMLPRNSLIELITAGKDVGGISLLLAARFEKPKDDLTLDHKVTLSLELKEVLGI